MSAQRYRNVICMCCTLFVFINMGLISTAFTIYYPYIREIRGFSNTQVQVITTIRSIFAVISMQFAVRFYEKLDIRKGVAICLGISIIGYLILSMTASPAATYFAICLFGIAYGMGSMLPASILIRRWFSDHTGEALGIVAAGTGVSSFLLPFYTHFAVTRFGLSAAYAGEAVIVAVLGALCILLIRNYPEGWKEEHEPKKAPGSKPSQASAEDDREKASTAPGQSASDTPMSSPKKQGPVLTGSEEIRIRIFAFFTGVLCLSAAASLSMLMRTTGHEMEMVSRLMSILGIALIIAKVGYGYLADKLGNFPSTVLRCILCIVAMFLCTQAQDAPFWLLAAAIICTAIGFSLGTVGLSIVAADFSSEETYPKVLKRWQSLYSFGGLTTGVIPGIIADITGSYIPAYHIFLIIAVLSFFLLVPIYARIRKKTA